MNRKIVFSFREGMNTAGNRMVSDIGEYKGKNERNVRNVKRLTKKWRGGRK